MIYLHRGNKEDMLVIYVYHFDLHYALNVVIINTFFDADLDKKIQKGNLQELFSHILKKSIAARCKCLLNSENQGEVSIVAQSKSDTEN